MVFGAAMTSNTLDDLDVVNQMALKMGCPSQFTLSRWADVRLSQGDHGSFLFINNYLDDPIETTIAYEDELMLGGHSAQIPARQGLILPIEWQLRKGVCIHYATSEIINIRDDGATIELKTAQNDFYAELSLMRLSMRQFIDDR